MDEGKKRKEVSRKGKGERKLGRKKRGRKEVGKVKRDKNERGEVSERGGGKAGVRGEWTEEGDKFRISKYSTSTT